MKGRPRKVVTGYKRRSAGNLISRTPPTIQTVTVSREVVANLTARGAVAAIRDAAIAELGELPDRVASCYRETPGKGLPEIISIVASRAMVNIQRAAESGRD